MMFSAILTIIIPCLFLFPNTLQASSLSCDNNGLNCFQQASVPDNDLVVGVALPPASHGPTTEFIAFYTFKIEGYGFGALSLDGLNKTAYAGWNHGETRLVTPRIIEPHDLKVFTGPTITILQGTTENATHLTTVFRCENCLNIPLVKPDLNNANAPIGLILSTASPQPNQDVNAFIPFDPAKNLFPATINWRAARFSDYFERAQATL